MGVSSIDAGEQDIRPKEPFFHASSDASSGRTPRIGDLPNGLAPEDFLADRCRRVSLLDSDYFAANSVGTAAIDRISMSR